MSWRGSTTVSDRIFASLPYLLPLIDGLEFGQFLFGQFPALELVFIPLLPLIPIYRGNGFAIFVIFLALYLGVVRNENISHFIRFNTMQAILLDIILILCGQVVKILKSGLPVEFVLDTLNNMIFLGILAAFIYSVAQSLMGRYAEIPTLSDAVHMQVR